MKNLLSLLFLTCALSGSLLLNAVDSEMLYGLTGGAAGAWCGALKVNRIFPGQQPLRAYVKVECIDTGRIYRNFHVNWRLPVIFGAAAGSALGYKIVSDVGALVDSARINKKNQT